MMSPYMFVLSLLGLILGFVYMFAKLGIRRNDQRYGDEETELIQDLNSSLVKMEERIEALEVLLAEKGDSQGPPTYRKVMMKEE